MKTLSSLFREINTSGEAEISSLFITACPGICFFFNYLSHARQTQLSSNINFMNNNISIKIIFT